MDPGDDSVTVIVTISSVELENMAHAWIWPPFTGDGRGANGVATQ